VIAATFHFPSDQLWEMDAEDLHFWVEEARWIHG